MDCLHVLHWVNSALLGLQIQVLVHPHDVEEPVHALNVREEGVPQVVVGIDLLGVELDGLDDDRDDLGPIRDVGELLLIKGITPGMFYGSGEQPGLERYMTVYGMTPTGASGYTWPGRININTADLPVLAALLPSESVDLAQALYEYRQQMTEEKNSPNLSSSKWPENIAGFRGLGIDSRLIATSSDVFRVVAEAVLNETRLTATAVVQRLQNAKTGKWTCRILNRQIQ